MFRLQQFRQLSAVIGQTDFYGGQQNGVEKADAGMAIQDVLDRRFQPVFDAVHQVDFASVTGTDFDVGVLLSSPRL